MQLNITLKVFVEHKGKKQQIKQQQEQQPKIKYIHLKLEKVFMNRKKNTYEYWFDVRKSLSAVEILSVLFERFRLAKEANRKTRTERKKKRKGRRRRRRRREIENRKKKKE